MADASTHVLITGYQDVDTAREDSERLVGQVAFDLRPAIEHEHEHVLHAHETLGAVAQGVAV